MVQAYNFRPSIFAIFCLIFSNNIVPYSQDYDPLLVVTIMVKDEEHSMPTVSTESSVSQVAQLAQRDENLRQLSTMMLGTLTTNKLDLIATISFYGTTFFNVFRRYNSVYEIVFEDVNGDTFVQKDFTMRQSLQQLLCITDAQIRDIYTINLVQWLSGF